MTEPDNLTPEQQAELARYRLEQETRRHEVEQETKRIESRWAAYKAVGVTLSGTAAVGVLGALLSWHVQTNELALEKEKTEREIKLEEKKFDAQAKEAQRIQEQNYLQNFVADALNQDIQRRVDFAQYVGSVTLSKEMRMLWSEYHKDLERELTDTRKDLQDKIAERDQQLELADQANKQTIQSLNREIAGLRDRLSGQLPISEAEGEISFEIRRSTENLRVLMKREDVKFEAFEQATGVSPTLECIYPLPKIGALTFADTCKLVPERDTGLILGPSIVRTEENTFRLWWNDNQVEVQPIEFDIDVNQTTTIVSSAIFAQIQGKKFKQ